MRRIAVSLLLFVLFLNAPAVSPAQANPSAETAEVRARLGRILADPEFAPPAPVNNNLVRAAQWIKDQWEALWRFIGRFFRVPALSGGSGLKWVLFGAVCAAGVWLLVKLVMEFRFKRRSNKTGLKTQELHDMLDDVASTEPDVWLLQADRFARDNDYRRAFRSVFVAILLHLDRMDVIRFERSRTNGDYVRAVRGKGLTALMEVLLPLTLEFEVRWYGRRHTTENDYRRCVDQYNRIRTLSGPQPDAAVQPAGGS